MNPTLSEKEHYARSSAPLSSSGSVPRWLKDITKNAGQNVRINRMIYRDPTPAYSLRNPLAYLVESASMPPREDLVGCKFDDRLVERPEANSARYGRRSSLAMSRIPNNTSPKKNTYSPSPDYLNSKIYNPGIESPQQNLEKSWRGLNEFNQTHKGRLDSAKHFGHLEQTGGDYGRMRSPISTESSSSNSGYSPSFVEQSVPSRSKSVMSNYLPLYVYENIKKATEKQAAQSYRLNKSRSSDSIHYGGELDTPTDSRSDTSFFVRRDRDTAKYDPAFEKRLFDYRMKIIKENELREQIINELLSENEQINTDLLKRRSSDTERYLRTSLTEDYSAHRRMYSRNSKYKSRQSFRKEIFDSDYDSDNGLLDETDSIFIIPELPCGQVLIIDVVSTWGDKYYVGMNGIEIFDRNGEIARVRKISAIPPDVNVLPECNNDPRVVQNLLDGVNRTQDDMHIWLAPFDEGCSHIITIEFEEATTIAMIRIWNYNKSRIHSYRGVRDIVMLLDGFPIFKGEIAKASGTILGGIHTFGDTILFTTDADILENISKNDTSYTSLTSEPETPVSVDRPLTSARHSGARPITGRMITDASTSPESATDQILLGAARIDLFLLSNWGHATIIGLTGIEIAQGDDTLPLNKNCITCNVEKKNIFMNRLTNGRNITTDPRSMWSTLYRYGEDIVVSIDLGEFKYISGVRIWNLNESLEKSYGGVRTMKIYLDSKPITNPLTRDEVFLLRRAPGNEHYDYVQDIKFTGGPGKQMELPAVTKDDSSTMPEGFVFQFMIYSTWGDQYYCGLNGIEMYDEYGAKVALDEQNICAYPESINTLPDVNDDVRTPDKLIDEINDDPSGVHSWMAPIVPKHLNRIYIVMDQPITVSYIKIWNYSKTPTRGVKDFGILVDDLLVYSGTLNKFNPQDVYEYSTVLFTENDDILGPDGEILKRNSNVGQDIMLFNEDITSTNDRAEAVDPALRPFTSVSPYNRGSPSFSS